MKRTECIEKLKQLQHNLTHIGSVDPHDANTTLHYAMRYILEMQKHAEATCLVAGITDGKTPQPSVISFCPNARYGSEQAVKMLDMGKYEKCILFKIPILGDALETTRFVNGV